MVVLLYYMFSRPKFYAVGMQKLHLIGSELIYR
jgi:hypothetical protein